MLSPLTQVFSNAISLHETMGKLLLKYIVINLHDTNISNILRFLKYFEQNGYDKFVGFSSSIRFELVLDRKLLDG
jgi:hypothetical protein